jgi:hypothetical protein
MMRSLHNAQTHQLATAGIAAGLQTAALLDPEPYSKIALTIAAACVSIFRNVFSGCGATCTAATRVVDQLEPYLQQNLAAYLSQATRTATLQAQALSVVDAILADVRSGCSDPTLGDAGRRCISERLVKGGPAPWCPSGTGCDWITLYRDPIANDPGVQAGALSSVFTSASGGLNPLPLAAALLLLWVILS